MHHHRNLAGRIGAWSAAHRKCAILGWIAFVVVSSAIGGAVGLKTLDSIDTENGDSYIADQAIDKAGFVKNVNEQVLVQGRGDVRFGDPELNAGVRDVQARLKARSVVQNVKSPLDVGNDGQVSKDGRSALVTFELKGDIDQAEDRVDRTLAAVDAAQKAHPVVRIEQFGDASSMKALTESFEDAFRQAETLSLPITLVVLLLAFGALVAAGLPLLLGFTAVLATLGLIGPASQLVPVDNAISSVILLIGLAVGVDYCMFYVRREMEERDAGRTPEAALRIAAATSGRAILVSGGTVMIAMAGMFFAGNRVFTSFAFGTIIVVAVAMLGSVTVLPAMLARLGRKGWTEKGRVPYLGKLRHRRHESRVWGAILTPVLRRPAVAAVASAGVLVVLALPALDMQTVNSGVQGIPRDLPIRAVRAVDGLPRVHPQPRARAGRPRPAHRGRGRRGHQEHRRRRDERGGRDGRRVRDLRHARRARLQDDGRRAVGGRRARRHDRPRGCCCRRR